MLVFYVISISVRIHSLILGTASDFHCLKIVEVCEAPNSVYQQYFIYRIFAEWQLHHYFWFSVLFSNLFPEIIDHITVLE